MIAVGAGVGVPLGIAVVALLFMIGRERRKNAQLRKRQFAVEAVNNQTGSMGSSEADRGTGKGDRYNSILEMSEDRAKQELNAEHLQELSAEPVQELAAQGVRRQ